VGVGLAWCGDGVEHPQVSASSDRHGWLPDATFNLIPGLVTMSKLIAQLKQIILFLLSPLFALAYMAVFPGVALQMLFAELKGKSGDKARV